MKWCEVSPGTAGQAGKPPACPEPVEGFLPGLVRGVFWVGLGLVLGCGDSSRTSELGSVQPEGPAWFEDATGEAGIDFVHRVEVSGDYLYPESIGSGAAWLDFDNDGRLDVFLIHNVSGTSSNTYALFQQQADGRFTNVSAGSGLDVAGYGQGVAVGDVNNDGLPEVLITELDRIRLFKNLGDGRFQDMTAEAGLSNPHWSVPAAFVDYDRDGWLDLVVGNYLDFDPTQQCPDAKGRPDFCGPHGFPSTLTRLYRNTSSEPGEGRGQGRFEDVTVASGLARAPGKAMEIVCADFDGNRWPDIFITDDGLPNRLFMNQGDGTFKEEAVTRGLAYTGMGAAAADMGVAIGDTNGDGLFDLFVPHLAEEPHTLWRQGPAGVFQDQTALAGLQSAPGHSTGFGAALADFDHDGAPDLVVVNGLVRRGLMPRSSMVVEGLPAFWAPYAAPNQLFQNDGKGRYQQISAGNPDLCGKAAVGRGLACGDVDNDGDVDLLITSIASPARLLRNVAPKQGRWLGVRAVDPSLGGRDAYGAEVRVEARGQIFWRLVQPAYSYASSNDPRVHFGLGFATQVDSIEIRWPDGTDEKFPGGAVDRYVVLRRGAGRAMEH